MSDNAILLETEVELCAERCAEFNEKNGTDDPDLLVEYGKALFNMAKNTTSLVNPDKKQEPLPVENPNIQLPESDDEIPEVGNDADDGACGPTGDSSADNDASADEGEEDGEADDFTVAFEVLDAARVLYSKMKQTDDIKRKLINVRQLLGDVSLEDDNPQQAVEDYEAAVALKKEVYGPLTGEVSISEYTLSLAYDALGKPQKSREHLQNSVESAKAARLPSAETLEIRLKDLDEELKLAKRLKGKDGKMAKSATLEGIVGREAVETAVKSLVEGANDISGLTRKRKKRE